MAEIIRSVIAQRSPHELEGPKPLSREVEDAAPYPIEALGQLRSAVDAIQAHTQAPVAICAQSILGAVSLAVQAHGDVELPSGQTKPTSLYLLTVAASGERKTAVDQLALKAIYDREAELRETYKREKSEFDLSSQIWEAQRSEAMNSVKSARKKPGSAGVAAEADARALGNAPEPPLTPILVCPDPTFEGYCKLTATGQPALGLYSAEGGAFIGGYGMSADHRLKTASGLSSVWDGDPIKRVRAGDGAVVLAGRRLSMHLMAQPEVAVPLLNDRLLIGQGLFSRILVAAPQSTAGTRFYSPPPKAARDELERYSDQMAVLLKVAAPAKEGSRNELAPRRLRLTEDAARIWVNFHDHVEEHLADGKAYAPISGFANKAAEHAARLAAQQALWSDIESTEITAASMANATNLAQYYLLEHLRLRSMAAMHGPLQLAQRVLDWLQAKWPEPAMYPAVIYNDVPIRELRHRRAALRIISILEEHGWLIRQPNRVWINGHMRNECWLIYGRTLA